MFVASKYEEIYPPCIADFTYISADTYSPKQIRDMEMSILKTLDYKMNKPFSLQFLRRYSKVTKSTTLEHSMAKFILEQAMMDCELAAIRPSLRAAGALVLSLSLLRSKHAKDSRETIEAYSRFSKVEVSEVKRRLQANLTPPTHPKKLDSIMQKYSSRDFLGVAKHSSLSAIINK